MVIGDSAKMSAEIYTTFTLEQIIKDSWVKLLKIEIVMDCVYTRY